MSTENTELDTEFEDEIDAVDDSDLEVVVDEDDEGDEGDTPAVAEDEDAPPADAPQDEAEDPDAPVDDEEEQDAELAAMPDKVKKRFMREKRLRDTIIQERDQLRGVAIQVANLAKQRETEVGTLKQQNAALQKQFAETLDYAYERDISITAADIRRAKEDGNYDVELKLQGDLDKLRFQQNQLRQVKASLPAVDAVPRQQSPQQAPQAAPPQQQQAPRPPPAPLAVKWINNNKAWFLSPKFKAHHNFVRTVDAEIVAEGYDPQSPEYYRELDRRVDGAFPTLRKKQKPPASPVGGVGSAPASNSSSRTIKLGKSDLANMRRYGLDPTNKDHLREYARSKRAA